MTGLDDQREALAQEVARICGDGHLWDPATLADREPAGLYAAEERARERYRAHADRLAALVARPSAPTITIEQFDAALLAGTTEYGLLPNEIDSGHADFLTGALAALGIEVQP